MDAYASAAAEAFREVERVSLLLSKKQKELLVAVMAMAIHSDDKSRTEYFDLTNQMLKEYDDKRAKI